MTDDIEQKRSEILESLDAFLGPMIEREPENPEGAKELEKILSSLDNTIESLSSELEAVQSLRDNVEEVRSRWAGEPIRGPGPLDFTDTPFLSKWLMRGHGVSEWGNKITFVDPLEHDDDT